MADRDLSQRGAENSGEGNMDEAKGRVKDAVGGLTGDKSMQAEGKWDKAKGKAKDALGDAQRRPDRETDR